MSDSRKRAFAASTDGTETGEPHQKAVRRTASDAPVPNHAPWSLDLHREFVSAIYNVGMKHSSPSVILENMTQKPAVITTERIKSHLQKYRASRQKSKQEFMDSYTAWLDLSRNLPPHVVWSTVKKKQQSCGEMAAFLTYCTMAMDASTDTLPGYNCQQEQEQSVTRGLRVPRLTEEEKTTPLGESICYVTGLISSMSRHVMRERAGKAVLAAAAEEQFSIAPPAAAPPQQQQQDMPDLSNPQHYWNSNALATPIQPSPARLDVHDAPVQDRNYWNSASPIPAQLAQEKAKPSSHNQHRKTDQTEQLLHQ